MRNRMTMRCLLLALAVAVTPMVADDDKDPDFEGSVEVVYRNVSTDGSSEKYDEDFDGLDSGLRIDNFSANWLNIDSGVLDHARIDVAGLGGDPYERQAIRIGRKDKWDFRFTNTKQDYLYNLFELVPDEDGASWDAERRKTDLNLRIYATDKIQLFFDFQNVARDGDSQIQKDIQREVFLLDTPLDTESKRYSVGANFRFGQVDFLFRQQLRRYDNDFNNSTDNNSGLEAGSPAALQHYEWLQNDSGGTDLTTLKVNTPLGNRAHLTASVMGTLIGDVDLDSRVDVTSLGTAFDATEFGGRCSISGTACSSDVTCDAIDPGDTCVPIPGSSRSKIDGDYLLYEADLSVDVIDPLTFHLQYQSLDRDLDGDIFRDLSGTPAGEPDGIDDDPDGDGIAGSRTSNEYEVETVTALFEYRPIRELTLRAGYRLIHRELTRDGYGDGAGNDGVRDIDFESDSDDTLILGVVLRPVKWFKLNADYEDGDIDQPFNAVAPYETKHTRVRAMFTPQEGKMRIDLGYTDFDNRNTAPDIRAVGERWNGDQDGDTWSVAYWHKANDQLDYYLRWAEQDFDSDVRVVFDQAGFASTEDGNSVFTVDNNELQAQINYRWSRTWRTFLRYSWTESDGDNVALGDLTGVINNLVIDQEYSDIEVGAYYDFASGMFLGGSYRLFDYDDRNQLIEYDGDIFELRAGWRF